MKIFKVLLTPIFLTLLTLADYLLTIIIVVMAVILVIPASVIGAFKKNATPKSKRLSEQDLETIITSWISAHDHQIESFKKNSNDHYDGTPITITPKNTKASPIIFDIGAGIDLWVTIKKYSIGFDYEDLDFYSLDEKTMNNIFTAYMNGNYYIEECYLGNEMIDGSLYFILDKNKTVGLSRSDNVKIIRRLFAKTTTHTFAPL